MEVRGRVRKGEGACPLGLLMCHHPDKGVARWRTPFLQSYHLKSCLKSAHLPALEEWVSCMSLSEKRKM